MVVAHEIDEWGKRLDAAEAELDDEEWELMKSFYEAKGRKIPEHLAPSNIRAKIEEPVLDQYIGVWPDWVISGARVIGGLLTILLLIVLLPLGLVAMFVLPCIFWYRAEKIKVRRRKLDDLKARCKKLLDREREGD